jgi:hypothetical protein
LVPAGEQHVPSLVLLPTDQGVLAVGAEPPVGSKLASGAGQSFVSTALAVLRPSAGLVGEPLQRQPGIRALASLTFDHLDCAPGGCLGGSHARGGQRPHSVRP